MFKVGTKVKVIGFNNEKNHSLIGLIGTITKNIQSGAHGNRYVDVSFKRVPKDLPNDILFLENEIQLVNEQLMLFKL